MKSDLLTFLVEKWDEDVNTFPQVNPVTLLKALMVDHELRPKDLAIMLGRSKGFISDLPNYKHFKNKEKSF